MVQTSYIHSLTEQLFVEHLLYPWHSWEGIVTQPCFLPFWPSQLMKKMNIEQLINNCSKSYIGKVKAAVGQAYLYRKNTNNLVSRVSPEEVTLKQRPKS